VGAQLFMSRMMSDVDKMSINISYKIHIDSHCEKSTKKLLKSVIVDTVIAIIKQLSFWGRRCIGLIVNELS